MTTKKTSIINIITPLLFLYLLYVTLPIGTIIGYGFKKISCDYFIGTVGICTNTDAYDNYYAILDFLIFILPFWIIIFVVWYFLLNNLNKKYKEFIKK